MIEYWNAVKPGLTESQLEQFDCYYRLLTEWNGRMNLTAITEPGEVCRKHFRDSVLGERFLPADSRCIDVGTGAGFPGIPLMIVRDDIHVTFLDSLNKRLVFLNEVLEQLNLSSRAETVHMRAEDAGQDMRYRNRYDVALTRAVASLPVLLELTVPFLKKGGISVCYKGDVREELELAGHAAAVLNCEIETSDVTEDYGIRTIVLARKIGTTAAQYPRKAGIPAKKPL